MTEEGKEYLSRRHTGLLIPAGLFIGLGIGLLAGYAAPGLMIGLGLGFVGSAVLKHEEYPAGDVARRMRHNSRLMPALLGIFFIILGISMVRAPQNFWPYIGAGFLILVGIWFIARSFGKA